MFYLRYLRNELVRRRTRTLVTLLGLGVGVALVIALASLAKGLDRAQKKTLDPLAGIGTDLTVTLQPQQNQGGFGFAGGGNRDLIAANQSVLTDLSKLGKPGGHFSHDFFLPGSQLTFRQSAASQVAKLANVAQTTTGLTLLAEHQQGIVPKIVAKLKTGGRTFRFSRNIARPTAAQFQKMQACFDKLRGQNGGNRQNAPQGQGRTGGGFFGGGGAGRGAFAKCLPASLRRLRTQFTTPQQTLRQVLSPPQTNIQTTAYTIGGVDQTRPDMGVVTKAQVTKGGFLAPAGGREALISTAYAAKQKLKVGSSLRLNGRAFRVVGLVEPPLGGQSADVYLPLKELQSLAGERNLANVVLVRATSSSKVAAVEREIERALPGASVASSKQVAAKISGSLVDASKLSHDLGLLLSILAAAAAFLLAALLAVSSVGKRVRELGTLKALGWTQRMVVRQVAGESLVQGVLGGLLGVALGVLIAVAVDAFGPTLTASATTGGGISLPGITAETTRTATNAVSLSAPVGLAAVAIGFGLAVLGGLIAGGAGALRAARLRPADALRQVE